ncbi:DUF6168 family protein [uncultured Maribacter sp.]|uniref:DUF6168 family protein n=1 Tax=uncultured Maribacter sp. TaxID=431308 RepID=UPI003429A8FC
MLKSFIQYSIVFTILFFVAKHTHLYFIKDSISFSLGKMYLYHYIFSLGICLFFGYLAFSNILENQLGLIYLAALFLKIIFFVIIFKDVILSETPIPRIERVYMLFPLILFLSVEVLFISRILRRL